LPKTGRYSRRDVIDLWREESTDEPKRNAAKLAEKSPKTRNAEKVVSASAANSHGPGSLKIGQLRENLRFESPCAVSLQDALSIKIWVAPIG
jgi:hypothetical protein